MSNAYQLSVLEDPGPSGYRDTASGPWSVDVLTEPQTARRRPRAILLPMGICVLLAFSSVTSVVDPWVQDSRRQTQPTAFMISESIGRRRISRQEARRLALRFMEQMEAARLQAAEDEARRAFPLEGVE